MHGASPRAYPTPNRAESIPQERGGWHAGGDAPCITAGATRLGPDQVSTVPLTGRGDLATPLAATSPLQNPNRGRPQRGPYTPRSRDLSHTTSRDLTGCTAHHGGMTDPNRSKPMRQEPESDNPPVMHRASPHRQSDEAGSRQESRARVGRSLPDRSMGRSLRSGSCSTGCKSRRGGEPSRSCWGRISIEAIPLDEPRGKPPLRAGSNWKRRHTGRRLTGSCLRCDGWPRAHVGFALAIGGAFPLRCILVAPAY